MSNLKSIKIEVMNTLNGDNPLRSFVMAEQAQEQQQKKTGANMVKLHNGKFVDAGTANGLTQAIISRINFEKGFVQRVNVVGVRGRTTGIKGTPDIVGMYKGRFVGVEIKIGRDKQSSEQKEWQIRCVASGGTYIIARQWEQFVEEWEHFKKELRGEKNELVRLAVDAGQVQAGQLWQNRQAVLKKFRLLTGETPDETASEYLTNDKEGRK